MSMNLDPPQRLELLELARASIDVALEQGELAPYRRDCFHPELNRAGASFVTLRNDNGLRGCCGTIDATRPLTRDVWDNAWAAAFADPRFPPLLAEEWLQTSVQISVLGEPQRCAAGCEMELIRTLRPGVDGLILQFGARRTTFLPAVWEQLPDPVHFVRHLKLKAGWPMDFWPAGMQAWRYTALSF